MTPNEPFICAKVEGPLRYLVGIVISPLIVWVPNNGTMTILCGHAQTTGRSPGRTLTCGKLPWTLCSVTSGAVVLGFSERLQAKPGFQSNHHKAGIWQESMMSLILASCTKTLLKQGALAACRSGPIGSNVHVDPTRACLCQYD